MKYTALTIWISVGCLSLYGANRAPGPEHNVAASERSATLRQFTLRNGHYSEERPILTMERGVTPVQSDAEKSLKHETLPEAHASASKAEIASNALPRCLLWGPWPESSLRKLHETLTRAKLEKNMRVIPFGNDLPITLYTLTGTQRDRATTLLETLRKKGETGAYLHYFDKEGYGIILGRYRTESQAQHAAQDIGRTFGLTHLNIGLDDGSAQRYAFLWLTTSPNEQKALRTLALRYHEAALGACREP